MCVCVCVCVCECVCVCGCVGVWVCVYTHTHIDRAGARRTLEEAAAQDPGNVAALCNLGGMYYDAEDFAASLRVLDAALARAPSVPEVICSRANTLHRLNRTEEAISEYARVVEAHPRVLAYRRGLADLLAGLFSLCVRLFCSCTESLLTLLFRGWEVGCRCSTLHQSPCCCPRARP